MKSPSGIEIEAGQVWCRCGSKQRSIVTRVDYGVAIMVQDDGYCFGETSEVFTGKRGGYRLVKEGPNAY